MTVFIVFTECSEGALYSYRQGCWCRGAVVLSPDTCAASLRAQQELHHNHLSIKQRITPLTTAEPHLKLNA